MRQVHAEPLKPDSYLLRVGSENWTFGEPYDLSLIVVRLDNKACELKGLDKPITIADWRAIKDCLYENGYRKAIFERRKNGKTITKEITKD